MHDDPPRSPAAVLGRARGLITEPSRDGFQRLLGPYSSLRGNRSFLLLFVAHTLSAVIDWLYVVALFILAYGLTHSATIVALLTFTRLLPYALLLPISGAITDRVSPRLLMVGANVGRALAMFALILVHSAHALPLAFLLVFVSTTLASLFRPALLASVPGAVPERQLIAANSVIGQVDMAAFGGGPALAGFILLLFDARAALIVAGVGLLFSAVAAGAARLPARVDVPAEGSRGLASTLDGLGFLFRASDRVLLGIALAWSGLTLWGGAYWALSVVLAEHSFHLGGAGVGFINGSYAIGGLVGGFLVAPAIARAGPAALFIAGAAGSSIAEALFGFSPAGVLPFVFFFLTGMADALAKITATTTIQSATPRHLLGRVFGAFESIFVFAMALGSLIVGPLINFLGVREASAVIAGLGLALLALALPALARLERALGVRVFLFQVPVLNLLPFGMMDEVVDHLHLERYREGDTIVRQDDPGDCMYIVKSGHVSVELENPGERRVLTQLSRADYFGEIALLEDVRRTATCRCVDTVEVYALRRADFQRLLNQSEEFAVAIRAEGSARERASRSLLLLHG